MCKALLRKKSPHLQPEKRPNAPKIFGKNVFLKKGPSTYKIEKWPFAPEFLLIYFEESRKCLVLTALQKNMAFCAIEKMEKIYGSLRIKKEPFHRETAMRRTVLLGGSI